MASDRPENLNLSDAKIKELESLIQNVKRQHILSEDLSQTYSRDYQKYLSFIPDDSNQEPNATHPVTNELLKQDWMNVVSKPAYQHNYATRSKLPVFKHKEIIINTIIKEKVIIICGETGSGKTTQLPQFVLDYYLSMNRGSECSIVCTQPRRISATSIAKRVAVERAEPLGCSVGYQVRFDRVLPRKRGSILYCTTGILLQKLKSDRFLKEISHIFLDEVHERDLDTDFIMVIIKSILERRSDLRVILMSASVNAEIFSEYFGDCPIIEIPGSCFPVEKLMLEDVIELLKYKPTSSLSESRFSWTKQEKLVHEEFYKRLHILNLSPSTIQVVKAWQEDKIDLQLIAFLIKHICQHEGEGAILVFLPGWDQIITLINELEKDTFFSQDEFLIIALHSKMRDFKNNQVFTIPPKGVRKIVVATNIAETSITIPDVVYVIDSGKANIANYDSKRDLKMLQTTWIAKANAIQRRGRAGRVQAGKCYHLFTSAREQLMADFIQPEILRMRLESLCLRIKILNLGSIKTIADKTIDGPSPEALDNSIKYLKDLNALDAEEYLTPLGFHLARLPLDPAIGKMILLGAIFSCLDPIMTIAASLSTEREFFRNPTVNKQDASMVKKLLGKDFYSDHVTWAKAYQEYEETLKEGDKEAMDYCKEKIINLGALQDINEFREDLSNHLYYNLKFLHSTHIKDEIYNINSDKVELLRAIICASLYPNVARFKSTTTMAIKEMITKKNLTVLLHPKSVNYKVDHPPFQWGVYHKIMETKKIYLHDLTFVNPFSLVLFGGQMQTQPCLGKTIFQVSDWIRFICNRDLESLIKELHKMLEQVLVYKIQQPGPTDWRKEGKALQPIINLLCSLDHGGNPDQLSLEELKLTFDF